MLVSYQWLKDYIKIDASIEDLAEKITRSGIEVEAIDKLEETVKNVVVGHVISKDKHPDADKLNICMVDLGEETPQQIVCGAPNVEAGQYVIVAKVGAHLPGGKIKRGKLRGQVSNGMICSLQELGISSKLVAKEYQEGIYVFPEPVTVGTDALVALGLNGGVMELGLTPNRADALNMLGVAYEVGALYEQDVLLPEVSYQASDELATDRISVEVQDEAACPLYIAKVIKNVTIKPSPLWLQGRLIQAGIRPINNIVDITNYVLIEYGQPLHAFDADQIGSNNIVVRRAKEGEMITTLDDVERTLTAEQLVITNGQEAIALAGVMGGKFSEVAESTTNIVLEAAYFNPLMIRRTSAHHGLRSESSVRFEKGIDPYRVGLAVERAAQLMAQYGGGTVLDGEAEFNHLDITPAIVEVSVDKINRVTGLLLTAEQVADIFGRLGFVYRLNNDNFEVEIPTRRGDITLPEDLVEEVARLYGYDNIPATLPKFTEMTAGGLTIKQRKRREVKKLLQGLGLNEAITYALTSQDKATSFVSNNHPTVSLLMPMSEERSTLRQNIVSGLLDTVAYNVARSQQDIRLFEIGRIFYDNGEQLPIQKEHLAGVLTGNWTNTKWQGHVDKIDFFTAKGVVAAIFEKLNVSQDIEYKAVEIDKMHPGRTAAIYYKTQCIGFVGQVHPLVQAARDIKETYVFEIDLSYLLALEVGQLAYQSIPKYPAISRDIAILVDKEIPIVQWYNTIKQTGGRLLSQLDVFDLYRGDKLPEGKQSVAFALVYQDPNKTLTDEEITGVHEKIMAQLIAQGAEIR